MEKIIEDIIKARDEKMLELEELFKYYEHKDENNFCKKEEIDEKYHKLFGYINGLNYVIKLYLGSDGDGKEK